MDAARAAAAAAAGRRSRLDAFADERVYWPAHSFIRSARLDADGETPAGLDVGAYFDGSGRYQPAVMRVPIPRRRGTCTRTPHDLMLLELLRPGYQRGLLPVLDVVTEGGGSGGGHWVQRRFIVAPWCAGGSLATAARYYDADTVRAVLRDAAEGLRWLNQRTLFLNGAVRPDHILIHLDDRGAVRGFLGGQQEMRCVIGADNFPIASPPSGDAPPGGDALPSDAYGWPFSGNGNRRRDQLAFLWCVAYAAAAVAGDRGGWTGTPPAAWGVRGSAGTTDAERLRRVNRSLEEQGYRRTAKWLHLVLQPRTPAELETFTKYGEWDYDAVADDLARDLRDDADDATSSAATDRTRTLSSPPPPPPPPPMISRPGSHRAPGADVAAAVVPPQAPPRFRDIGDERWKNTVAAYDAALAAAGEATAGEADVPIVDGPLRAKLARATPSAAPQLNDYQKDLLIQVHDGLWMRRIAGDDPAGAADVHDLAERLLRPRRPRAAAFDAAPAKEWDPMIRELEHFATGIREKCVRLDRSQSVVGAADRKLRRLRRALAGERVPPPPVFTDGEIDLLLHAGDRINRVATVDGPPIREWYAAFMRTTVGLGERDPAAIDDLPPLFEDEWPSSEPRWTDDDDGTRREIVAAYVAELRRPAAIAEDVADGPEAGDQWTLLDRLTALSEQPKTGVLECTPGEIRRLRRACAALRARYPDMPADRFLRRFVVRAGEAKRIATALPLYRDELRRLRDEAAQNDGGCLWIDALLRKLDDDGWRDAALAERMEDDDAGARNPIFNEYEAELLMRAHKRLSARFANADDTVAAATAVDLLVERLLRPRHPRDVADEIPVPMPRPDGRTSARSVRPTSVRPKAALTPDHAAAVTALIVAVGRLRTAAIAGGSSTAGIGIVDAKLQTLLRVDAKTPLDENARTLRALVLTDAEVNAVLRLMQTKTLWKGWDERDKLRRKEGFRQQEHRPEYDERVRRATALKDVLRVAMGMLPPFGAPTPTTPVPWPQPNVAERPVRVDDAWRETVAAFVDRLADDRRQQAADVADRFGTKGLEDRLRTILGAEHVALPDLRPSDVAALDAVRTELRQRYPRLYVDAFVALMRTAAEPALLPRAGGNGRPGGKERIGGSAAREAAADAAEAAADGRMMIQAAIATHVQELKSYDAEARNNGFTRFVGPLVEKLSAFRDEWGRIPNISDYQADLLITVHRRLAAAAERPGGAVTRLMRIGSESLVEMLLRRRFPPIDARARPSFDPRSMDETQRNAVEEVRNAVALLRGFFVERDAYTASLGIADDKLDRLLNHNEPPLFTDAEVNVLLHACDYLRDAGELEAGSVQWFLDTVVAYDSKTADARRDVFSPGREIQPHVPPDVDDPGMTDDWRETVAALVQILWEIRTGGQDAPASPLERRLATTIGGGFLLPVQCTPAERAALMAALERLYRRFPRLSVYGDVFYDRYTKRRDADGTSSSSALLPVAAPTDVRSSSAARRSRPPPLEPSRSDDLERRQRAMLTALRQRIAAIDALRSLSGNDAANGADLCARLQRWAAAANPTAAVAAAATADERRRMTDVFRRSRLDYWYEHLGVTVDAFAVR